MSRIIKLENIYKGRLKNHKVDNVSEFLQSILDTDITKGKYARFLIETFLNDKFLEEDLVGGLESTIGQAISLFDKHKHKLPLEHRSVYALNPETGEALYQSPGDLWNNVKQYQGELSGKELKQEEQEKVYRETEFVYKDENTGFQIVCPLTEESAKWWGKGTRWCTSAEKNNMFWNYAKQAPLLILLMPASASTAGNGDKFQLWKDDNRIQFMDEADKKVSLSYIKKNWNILEPICLWLNDFQLIPKEYETKELYELAVKQNGEALKWVPKEHRTKELCELAVKQNGDSLYYIPKHLITEELCKIAVQQNGLALYYIPDEYITKEMCKIAVEKNGMALWHVLDEYKTKKICELAVQQNGEALQYIPVENKTFKLCKLAIKSNGKALRFVPKKYKTKGLCLEAIKNNGKVLQWVPEEYKKELQHYVKNEILELEIPLEQYQNIFQEIKTLFPKKDVSLSYHHS
jgi:hypothetical protein